MHGANRFGTVPIGAIVAWLHDFAGVPSLPPEYWLCDGSSISDSESLLNGATTPNLNGNKNFLRGNVTSGGTSGAANHSHTVDAHHHDVTPASGSLCDGSGSAHSIALPSTVASSDANPGTDVQSNIPPSYDVVWVIRIK